MRQYLWFRGGAATVYNFLSVATGSPMVRKTFRNKMVPETTPEKLKAAIAEFDLNLRDTHDWQGWEDNRAHKYAIRYNSRLYPAKKIVSLATGMPVSDFSGGDGTNSFLRSYGFEVIPLRTQA